MSRLKYFLTAFAVLVFQLTTIEAEEDKIILTLDGKEYTCFDIVGVTYQEGLDAVARVQEKYGAGGEKTKGGGLLLPSDLYPGTVPKDYIECYHQQLGGAATWFLLGKVLDSLMEDHPETSRQLYDPVLLDRAIREHCRVMQAMADAEMNVFLLPDDAPSFPSFLLETKRFGVSLGELAERGFHTREMDAPLVALFSACKKFEMKGEPTLWAYAYFRHNAMAPLLQRIIDSNPEKAQEALKKCFGVYPALIITDVYEADVKHVADFVALVVSEDGSLATGGVHIANNLFRSAGLKSNILQTQGTIADLRRKYAIHDDQEVASFCLVELPENKEGRKSFVYIHTNEPKMPFQQDKAIPGNFLYESARNALISPYHKKYMGGASLAEGVPLPTHQAISGRCAIVFTLHKSLYGNTMPPDPFK